MFECGCAKCNVRGKKIVCATTVRQLNRDYFVALCEKCSEEFAENKNTPGIEEEFKENTEIKAVRVPLMRSTCVSCLTSGQIQSGVSTHSIYWDGTHIPNLCKDCADFWKMQDMYLRGKQREWVDMRYEKFNTSLKIREVRHEKVVVFA